MDADLARRSLPGVRGHLGILIVILFTTTLYRDAPRVANVFVGLSLFHSLFRFLLVVKKKWIYERSPDFWRYSLYASLLLSAGTVGWLAAVCICRYGYADQNSFFTSCCVVGITAGSVNSLTPDKRIAIAYLVFSFAPAQIADLIRGGPAGYSLFGGTALLWVYLTEQSRELNGDYKKGLSDNWNLRLRTKELQTLAHHDPLTGVPNKLFLRERFSEAVAQGAGASRMALLYIDLDRFKQINDSFSHRIGDLYISAVAARVSRALAPNEVLARIGGDEFLLLVTGLSDTEYASERAQYWIDCLKSPVDVEGSELPVSASIGLSLFPDHGTDLEMLQKHADLAMYRAKSSGRSRFQVFTPQMAAKQARVAMIEQGLRSAITGKGLLVNYQLQVDLSGCVCGLEALLRFHTEALGSVSPAEFIPVAEETGLIRPLGRWVLQEACRQAVEWQDGGLPPFRIAVNVSAAQLVSGDFPEEVEDVLRSTGLQPRFLELEVTESLFMRDLGKVAEHMNLLRMMGVRFSIDDFGAGYSSLSYLHKLPIDTVKIDKVFVNELGTTGGNPAVIESILALARSLQLTVIAEGVETFQQFSILRELGCAEFQGYWFAKPLPASLIPATVKGLRPIPQCQSTRSRQSATGDLMRLAAGLESAHSINAS